MPKGTVQRTKSIGGAVRHRLRLICEKEEAMTLGDHDLDAARQQILRRMQEPQSPQALSELRQELRAIDVELDNVKKIASMLADAPQPRSD
jgi:hypothetical protein